MQANLQMTITSAISIIIFSTGIAGILAIALGKDKLLGRVKYELLLICMAIPLVKILIPVEILPWTYNINVSIILPEIVKFLNTELFAIDDTDVTLWSVVLLALVIGYVIYTFKVVKAYVNFRRRVYTHPDADKPIIYELLDKILQEKGKKVNFVVKWIQEDASPMIGGLFQPYILLPKVELQDEEWEGILRHEIAHYLHGDLIIRHGWMGIKILCWWNPMVPILDKQFEQLMEICADENAVKGMSRKDEAKYISALISVSTEVTGSEKIDFCSSYLEADGIPANRRALIMMERGRRSRSSFLGVNVISTVLILTIAVVMNVFIFEPLDKKMGEVYEEGPLLTNENSFWIINADGTYDMYVGGKYYTTLDDTYGVDYPIYNSLEEALGYEEIQ